MKRFQLIIILLIFYSSIIVSVQSNLTTHEMAQIKPNQGYKENVDHNITSIFTNRTYWIKIDLPANYLSNSAPYPTLLYVDYLTSTPGGNVLDVYEWLSENLVPAIESEYVPELILVDILDSDFQRSIFVENMLESPNATLLFLENELLPFLISLNYNIDVNNIILSGSFDSGNMALNAFFNFPESIFAKFIVFNAEYYQFNETIFGWEAAYYNWTKQHPNPSKSLFISVETTDGADFNSAFRLSRTMFNRDNGNQNIIFRTFDYSWEEDAIIIGVHELFTNIPTIAFYSSVELDYWLGDIEEYVYYANESVAFLYFGNKAGQDINFSWFVDKEFTASGPKFQYNFTKIGQHTITLNMTYGTISLQSLSKTIIVYPEREPEFDFHTVETVLNSEWYKKKITTENLPLNVDTILIIIPIMILHNRRKKQYSCCL